MEKKVCSTCGIKKSFNEFYIRKDRPCNIRSYCKKCGSKQCKKYREINPDYGKQHYKNNRDKYRENGRRYQKERKQKDPNFKMDYTLRKLVGRALKGETKSKRTIEIIGCSSEQFWQHLEKQFTEGMTIKNHGKWHIDHIIPLSSAKTLEEKIKLSHYTNLQPLWAKDNLTKNNKLDWTKDIPVR